MGLKKLAFLKEELFSCEDRREGFRSFWKMLEYFLTEDWKKINWDSSTFTQFESLIKEVLNGVDVELYARTFPVLQRLLWFCDDFQKSTESSGLKTKVARFHAELIAFRKKHSSAFEEHSNDVMAQFESDLVKQLSANYSYEMDDDYEDSWVKGDEEGIQHRIQTYIATCSEEKDFVRLGELLWKTFQHHYYEKSPLSTGLQAWLDGARTVIYQTTDHKLLVLMLRFFPVVLEHQYSVLTFRIQSKEFVLKLRSWLLDILTELHFSSDTNESLEQLISQYWKFFFYYLRREKFGAFRQFSRVFLQLMETSYRACGNYNYSGQVSEVYYSLISKNRKKYRDILLKELRELVESGSQCFKELFPKFSTSDKAKHLTEDLLLDEVLREVYRDGTVDATERQILMKLFAFLKVDREKAKRRMKAIEKEVREKGFQEGSLNQKELMRTLFAAAFADGEIDPKERKMLNAIGSILGLPRAVIADLYYEAREGTEKDGAEDLPVMVPAISFNEDFERNLQELKDEGYKLEGQSRDLKTLIQKQTINLVGDKVDWDGLFEVPVQVELAVLPKIHKVGLIFFVEKKGILILREVVQALSYILVEPGEDTSVIHLKLWNGKSIRVQQAAGFEFSSEFRAALKKYNGKLKMILVDSASQEIVTSMEYGCGVGEYSYFSQLEEALSEENYMRIKVLYRKGMRDAPWDRAVRNFHMRSLLGSGEFVSLMNELDQMYAQVREQDPGDFEFYYLYGRCLVQSGRIKEGIVALKRSLMINRVYLPALLEICSHLLQSGSEELYFYAKFLQVYFWNHPEVKSFFQSIDYERRREIWEHLCMRPLLLWVS